MRLTERRGKYNVTRSTWNEVEKKWREEDTAKKGRDNPRESPTDDNFTTKYPSQKLFLPFTASDATGPDAPSARQWPDTR